jgi:hypothetical protein
MNEAAQSDAILPGLEIAPKAPPPPADAPPASPRVKAVHRTQTRMRVVEVGPLNANGGGQGDLSAAG